MKASELIERLKKGIGQYGDHQVVMDCLGDPVVESVVFSSENNQFMISDEEGYSSLFGCG